MRRFLILFTVFLLILSLGAIFLPKGTQADELDDILKKLEELNRAREMSISATKPHEENLNRLKGELLSIQRRVDWLGSELIKKEKDIKIKELKLTDQEELLAARVRQFYIRSFASSPFLTILASATAADLTREMTYRKTVTDQDKNAIIKLGSEIHDLEKQKESLAGEKTKLAKVQEDVNTQVASLEKLIGGAKAYQAQLSSDIAGLTARQQQLLAQKYGGFTTSVGEVSCEADDPSNPFSPAFAAFSFGAPHRVGMSQYGALGRSRAGQSAEQILKAYFAGVEIKKDYPVPDTIVVDGYGRISFEDLYLKGIGEMPASWGDQGGMEALKAQAIAARTYALAATNNAQSSICASEACQVFIGSNKGGNWEKAVNETRGWVIVQGGQPIKAWYASTAGGFTRSSADMWGKATSYAVGIPDTSCGSSSCWPGDAYESPKYGNSCWFHKAWYKRYHATSSSRSHPWLTQEEFADIINSGLLYQADSGTISHLSQVDKGDSDTWSYERVKEELRKRGITPVSSIGDVPNPTYSNAGYTAQVSFNTDQGNKSFDGDFFKQIFNLRAPGEIHIASSLFNIEKR